MGNLGAAAVLFGVGIIIFLLVMFGFINIPFFNQREPNQWSVDISAASSGGAISNFQALVAVNPRGIIFVDANKPLQVNASDFEGWAFSSWLFDDADFGDTPYVVVPAQAPNSSHTLIAIFAEKLPTFQIRDQITSTANSQGSYLLYFKNNGEADISNIKIKLNDPYGVFAYFDVIGYQGTYSAEATNILNQYSRYPVTFRLTLPFDPNTGYDTLSANQEKPFAGGYVISPNIGAGTYELSFNILFTVSAGQFSEPPELTIPWQVTIIG